MTSMERKIVRHPGSGERYILEVSTTPGGECYRAAGPLSHHESPSDEEMRAWLDNQGYDAYDDGEWLIEQMRRE